MESYYHNWNPNKGKMIEKRPRSSYNNSFKRDRDQLSTEEKPEGVVRLIKEKVQLLRFLEKEED